MNTKPYPGAHFAVWPEELVEPMVKAGSKRGDTVLDPFSGSGTTGPVAMKLGRNYIGIDLNADYLEMAKGRLRGIKAPRESVAKDGNILDLFGGKLGEDQ